VALAVGDNSPHVLNVFFVIFFRVFSRVLLEDFDDLSATGTPSDSKLLEVVRS
jgi:hypothetical protein